MRFSPWACVVLGAVQRGSGVVDRTYLISGAAGQGAECALYGAGGLVEIALAGGGLVFVGRHDCDCGLMSVREVSKL